MVRPHVHLRRHSKKTRLDTFKVFFEQTGMCVRPSVRPLCQYVIRWDFNHYFPRRWCEFWIFRHKRIDGNIFLMRWLASGRTWCVCLYVRESEWVYRKICFLKALGGNIDVCDRYLCAPFHYQIEEGWNYMKIFLKLAWPIVVIQLRYDVSCCLRST